MDRSELQSRAPKGGPAVALRFDRGTILIDVETGDAQIQSRHLYRLLKGGNCRTPALAWDPRVARLRAPAHRHIELVETLRQRGVNVRDSIGPFPRLPLKFAAPTLRSYQRDAVLAWELANRHGIVVLPTGAGKTRLAMAAIERAGTSTLILVPTRVPCEQWRASLQRAGLTRIGQFGDGRRELAPVTVATFASGLRQMEKIGAYFGMLVVDEVHHFSTGARIEALEMSAARLRLGLTATLEEDGTGVLQHVMGPIVCRRTLMELVGAPLAPFELRSVRIQLTAAERFMYDRDYGEFISLSRKLRAELGYCSWPQFMRAAASSFAGRRALAGYHAARAVVSSAARKLEVVGELLARHRGQRTLVFCGSNRAAYALSKRYLIPAITADIGRKERRAILDDLAAGRLNAVVSSRVLNEGIDVPEAAVGIIVGGTMGVREHVQRVGRLLRPAEGKRAIVYELVVLDTFETKQSWKRGRGLLS